MGVVVKRILYDRSIVSEVVALGYCGGTGPMSCLLLSGQVTIILITIKNSVKRQALLARRETE